MDNLNLICHFDQVELKILRKHKQVHEEQESR